MVKLIGFYLLYFVAYLFSKLPFFVLYFISNGIFYLLFYVIKYRKKVVICNLLNSFPEKDDKEINQIAKSFYRHFSDFLVENIKMISITKKQVLKRVKFRNPEMLDAYFANRKLVLAAVGHYNNWEWISATSFMNRFQIVSMYKPLSNKRIDNLLLKMRSRFGTYVFPMANTLKEVIRMKASETPQLCCFITDQAPLDIHYVTSFLNQRTAVFLGLEKIARKFDLPIVFMKCEKVKRGYYEIEFIPITFNPAETKDCEITEKHLRILEDIIREKPEYWLWSHRRWKRQDKIIDYELNVKPNA